MKNGIKRIISIFVCCMMFFGMCSVCAQAASITPIIYVGDIGNNVLYSYPNAANPSPVFPPAEDELEERVMQIVGGILYTTVVGDSNQGTSWMNQGINGLLRDMICNEFGESQNGVGVNKHRYPLSNYTSQSDVMTDLIRALGKAENSVGLEHMYLFTYDWRLDPLENAASLQEFIKEVKVRENARKVSLLCAGNGGVIGNAYLYRYADAARDNVASCVFLNAPLLGHSIVGDVMTGNLTATADENGGIFDMYKDITAVERANALVRYVNDDPYGVFVSLFEDVLGETESSNQFVKALVWLINSAFGGQDVWKELAKAYNDYLESDGEKIYGETLRNFMRYAPGMWALVPQEDFDAAWRFLFPEDDASDKLTKKVNDFRAVSAATQQTLQNAKANGVYVSVVSGYNLQILPAGSTINEHSDCMILTKSASAGASAVKHGSQDVLQQANADGHNHRSPDHQIDASTAALPESTWFVRNLPNLRYESETAADFVMWLLTTGHQRTVWEDPDYSQYMSYSASKDSISPIGNENLKYFLGDANVDFHVNVADARTALRIAVGYWQDETEWGMRLADVNSDGAVTVADAREILRFCVGLGRFENYKP